MNTGARIKYLREQKGYSVNKLANLAGVSQSYLRDIELGNKNPTVAFLELICDSLQITLSYFFQDETNTSTAIDPLIAKINALTPVQRSALLTFLESFEN